MNKNANNISFEPTLSICVPTYNRKQLLRRLIESVTADVHEFTIELIVIDDGSTDNTDSLFADNEWHSNVRIVYEYQANTGRALALKRAIDKSSGQNIIIIDSDD